MKNPNAPAVKINGDKLSRAFCSPHRHVVGPKNDGTYIVEFRTAAMEAVRGKQPRLDFMREALAEHIARAIRRKTKSAAKEKRDT